MKLLQHKSLNLFEQFSGGFFVGGGGGGGGEGGRGFALDFLAKLILSCIVS